MTIKIDQYDHEVSTIIKKHYIPSKNLFYYWIGGTPIYKNKEINKWDNDQIKLILKNKKSGMFLDPSGYQFFQNLLKILVTTYSNNICKCCNDQYVKASCDMPVLGNHDLQASCLKRCENCNSSKKLRLCNGCKNTYYCSDVVEISYQKLIRAAVILDLSSNELFECVSIVLTISFKVMNCILLSQGSKYVEKISIIF